MNEKYISHKSIFLDETLEYLGETIGELEAPIMADLTFGGGGHTFAFVKKYSQLKVMAFDQDQEAINKGQKVVDEENLSSRLKLVWSNYKDFPEKFKEISSKDHFNSELKLHGILMDLGVSTHQFLAAERGFSFQHDGPLDMRMDQHNDNLLTAKEIINEYSEKDLADLFYHLGEERFSRRIAKNIYTKRMEKAFETTQELADLIFHSYPKKLRYSKRMHPATKCFMALRIFINDELNILKDMIPRLFGLLSPGGRLAIISFHSLEDRIVKVGFKEIEKNSANSAKILTKKPLSPSSSEVDENPRSRSAKLRVIEKLNS